MKTLKCTFILLFVLCYSLSFSQWHVGAHAGVTINDVKVSGLPEFVPDTKSLIGYTYGLQTEYDVNEIFSLVSGVDFARRGFTVEESVNVNILGIDVPLGAKLETQLNFIEIPMLGKVKFGTENFSAYVLAGPSVSYATSGQLKTKASVLFDINVLTTDINLGSDTYNRTNLAGVIGAGVEIPNDTGKFFADVRYQHSFTNMLNDPLIDLKIKPVGITMGIGYAMSF